MVQSDFIKDIAKFGLDNDREKLLSVIEDFIEHSKKTKKVNLAIQLQSLLKESMRGQHTNSILKVNSEQYFQQTDDREVNQFILEKLTSEYTFDNIICEAGVKKELQYFIQEHESAQLLQSLGLPISNRILLYGPSGCGKTLASYVIAGELKKMMVVINLGAIVSSKLGETSKNLSKVFRKASMEDCILFLDEFDSLGKIRDYDQDHGEMKRVVNTLLQLFDYLPQSSVLIAATNQKEMLDEALLRRFDISLKLELPNEMQIKSLIELVLKNIKFNFSNKKKVDSVIKDAIGLSYYSIQKTLITAIKRSLFASKDKEARDLNPTIDIESWRNLLIQEKKSLIKT